MNELDTYKLLVDKLLLNLEWSLSLGIEMGLSKESLRERFNTTRVSLGLGCLQNDK